IRCSRGCARVATASEDGTARIWDGISGRSVAVLRHGGAVSDLDVDDDFATIATASADGTAVVWRSPRTSRIELQTTAAKFDYGQLAPDGGRAMIDGTGIDVFELASGKRVATIDPKGHVQADGFTPDARFVDAGGHGLVQLWRAGDGARVGQA